MNFGVRKLESRGYRVAFCVILHLALLIQYRSMTHTHTHTLTDRRTDGHKTMAYTTLSTALHGKNYCSNYKACSYYFYNVFWYLLLEKLAERHIACTSTSSTSASTSSFHSKDTTVYLFSYGYFRAMHCRLCFFCKMSDLCYFGGGTLENKAYDP